MVSGLSLADLLLLAQNTSVSPPEGDHTEADLQAKEPPQVVYLSVLDPSLPSLSKSGRKRKAKTGSPPLICSKKITNAAYTATLDIPDAQNQVLVAVLSLTQSVKSIDSRLQCLEKCQKQSVI